MRIPKIESSLNNESLYEVREITDYSKIQRLTYDIMEDEKLYLKFIKKVERYIRGSLEYKEYVNFLKTEIDMNRCSFFNKVDRNKIDGIRLEIHHSPFTLFDLTVIVTNKHLKEYNKVNPLLIAKEVMELHFKGKVGLIPLSLTVHELVHSGEIFIPIDKVYGNIKLFLEEYKQYFTEEQNELLLKNIEMTEEIIDYKPAVLNKTFTYLKVDGMEFPKLLDIKQKNEIC